MSGPASAAEPARDPATARLDVVLPAGEGWCQPIARGETLRIVDLEGNQAVDTLFYALDDHAERYDASATIRAQGALYLTAGSRLLSNRGRALMTIVADTCGRHDTLGGACSCESNQARYGLETLWMHSCRDTFLLTLARSGRPLGKRDLAHNVNFFMNVPVTPDGALRFADGVSGPGRYVELRAELDTLVLISNCPQLNNPCNGWNPTPVRLVVWPASAGSA